MTTSDLLRAFLTIVSSNPVLERLFFASVESALLALAVRFGRIKSARMISLLWLVVLAKPIVSLAVGSPFVMARLPAPVSPVEAITIIPAPELDEGRAAVGTEEFTSMPLESTLAPAPRAENVLMDGAVGHQPAPATIAAANSGHSAIARPNSPTTPDSWMRWISDHAASVLCAAWIVGVCVCFARCLLDRVRLWRLLARTHEPSNQLNDLHAAIAAGLGIKHLPRLRITNALESPALVGTLRPVVLLPSWFVRDENLAQAEWSLRHELMHWKHRDPWANLVRELAQTLFYFHPASWWAGRKWEEAAEMACDRAIVTSDSDSVDYAEKLHQMLVEIRSLQRLPVRSGLFATRTQIGRRIAALLSGSILSPKRLSTLAAMSVVLVSAMALALGGGFSESPNNDKPEQGGASTDSKDAKSANGEKSDEDSKRDKAANSTKDVTIRGIVVDAHEKPAAGVRVLVRLIRGKYEETTTNGAGEFALSCERNLVRGQLIRAIAGVGAEQAAFTVPWKENEIGNESPRMQLRTAKKVELEVVDAVGKPVEGATVGAMSEYQFLESGATKGGGRIQFFVPAETPPAYLFAFKTHLGFDYKAFILPHEQKSDRNAKPPALPDGPCRLTLEGAHPVKIHVKESDGKPIAGMPLSVWLLKKPDQPEDINLSYFTDLVTTKTDAAGDAVFDWFPRWHTQLIQVWPDSYDYVRQRGSYDVQKESGPFTLELDRLVTIRGRVLMPDGSPAVGAIVSANGQGHQFDGFSGAVTADKQGWYELKAAPNMVYLMTANMEKFASSPRTGFAVWPEKPLENVDFQLRPATRLFGRVTTGSDRRPIKGQWIVLYQRGKDAHSIDGVGLPNPKESKTYVQPVLGQNTETDSNGFYELFVGSGEFDIRGPNQTEVKKFSVGDEKELEFDFHAERPESSPLRGAVVGLDGKPISDAKITCIYRDHRARRAPEATSNESGQFEFDREPFRTVLHARSADGNLAGVVEIGPDEESIQIPIGPMARATARLLDGDTNEPRVGDEIRYGVKVPIGDDDAAYQTAFGGTTKTDAKGRFELKSLIVGKKYEITVTTERDSEGNGRSWRIVGSTVVLGSATTHLGDLKLNSDRPLTLEQRIAAAFAAEKQGTPLERFEHARKIAALTDQHLLVVFGDYEMDAVKQFMRLRFEDDEVRTALYPFRVLPIRSGEGQREAARLLAARLGFELGDADAKLSIHVAKSDGSYLASADAGVLSENGKISKDRLILFLTANAFPKRDAQKLIDDALARAKAENKRVVLQQTATWCGPCLRLTQFVEKHRELWSSDYIWVKMDERWDHAAEIMNKFRGQAEGGIPWWIILDAEGKSLAMSNAADGKNIGFPSAKDEVAHFRTMLEKTALRLTPAEIDQLCAELEEGK